MCVLIKVMLHLVTEGKDLRNCVEANIENPAERCDITTLRHSSTLGKHFLNLFCTLWSVFVVSLHCTVLTFLIMIL